MGPDERVETSQFLFLSQKALRQDERVEAAEQEKEMVLRFANPFDAVPGKTAPALGAFELDAVPVKGEVDGFEGVLSRSKADRRAHEQIGHKANEDIERAQEYGAGEDHAYQEGDEFGGLSIGAAPLNAHVDDDGNNGENPGIGQDAPTTGMVTQIILEEGDVVVFLQGDGYFYGFAIHKNNPGRYTL